jgi:RIO-like serine/threonine protein kinase
MTRTREWLLLNAVEAWLHHYSYPPSETVEQYKKLRDEFHDTFMASIQPKDVEDDPPKRTTRKRTTNANKATKTV